MHGKRVGSAVLLRVTVVGLAGLLAHAAQAQVQGVPARAFTWAPHVAATTTVTDNLKLRDAEKDGAVILQVAPGISVQAKSPHLKGTLDYSINALMYGKTDRSGQIQQQLASRATAELVDNIFFVDGTATISQQTVSAQGVQSSSNLNPTGNRTEVGSLALSPYARGRLGEVANFETRVNVSETRAKDTIFGDSSSKGASLVVNGSGQKVLNWSATVATQKVAPKAGRETLNDRLYAALLYKPDIDVNLSVRGGKERTNYTSTDPVSSKTYGADAQWTPTLRTKFSLGWDHHAYGNSHSLSFEHRMSRSVWRYSDSRSVDNGGGQQGVGGRSNFDMLYSLLTSIEPDAAARQKRTNEMLQQYGLSADAIATPGFLTAALTIARRQELSFALEGLRNALTVQGSRTSNTRLGALSLLDDGLGGASVVRQLGLNVNLAHKLAADSSLSLLWVYQRSTSDLPSATSTLRSLSAAWTGRLGNRTSLALGVRHAEFDSTTAPYTENSVYGTLQQQF
ncbi:TIGR03016 family PEP-CTERM system-associated outer membrane protein [Paucibacter sp. APW11]|uniref:TIGR03016 family PEP-CTERM system-associated outer membrane protein n=1 Tax=Roseateles aquae TaxID=3077235 RepID=A0ABU3P6V4_9BURK|nr:TIGR03016 family PEP-CTERM system-associated outer membrane protein [Paucibacter sp. APW11]MDT8997950.1 TIGR03016 family PEP-CTERM system-associated outer membrane protein [Paucibacter sp. APW11]